MEQIKVRIWDSKESKWFKPEYSKNGVKNENLKEILLTQRGEVMIRERVDGVEKLTDDVENRYVINFMLPIKDLHHKKYSINDIVKTNTGYWVLTHDGFKLCLAQGEIDDYKIYHNVSEIELRNFELAGNIYENSYLLKNNLELV